MVHELKLMLIGHPGVGKTSILNRFSDDAFNSTFIKTLGGIDFRIKTIDLHGRKVKLQIWNTARQERFHTVTSDYCRGASGIILVYDITNRQSFDNISSRIKAIDKNVSQKVVKILVGNKCDVSLERAVSRESGEKLASDHAARFLETSAKENINIDAVFYELADAILERTTMKSEENPLSKTLQMLCALFRRFGVCH